MICQPKKLHGAHRWVCQANMVLRGEVATAMALKFLALECPLALVTSLYLMKILRLLLASFEATLMFQS